MRTRLPSVRRLQSRRRWSRIPPWSALSTRLINGIVLSTRRSGGRCEQLVPLRCLTLLCRHLIQEAGDALQPAILDHAEIRTFDDGLGAGRPKRPGKTNMVAE